MDSIYFPLGRISIHLCVIRCFVTTLRAKHMNRHDTAPVGGMTHHRGDTPPLTQRIPFNKSVHFTRNMYAQSVTIDKGIRPYLKAGEVQRPGKTNTATDQ